jgi:butyryl-CoA dehydrogenase
MTIPEEKMGIRASDTAQLACDNVIVPDAQVLGPAESGFKIAMSTLDGGRIGIASQALGISAAAYEAARAYSKQREQFGKPICEFPAVQWKIADMATRLEAARLLTYRAAWAKDEGGRYSEESAMAKLFASEASHYITNEAVQIFGGNGYSKEYPVERHFRDAKITEIYEGTSEAQRMMIASLELKK